MDDMSTMLVCSSSGCSASPGVWVISSRWGHFTSQFLTDSKV